MTLELLVIAGPNGSGKTTLTTQLLTRKELSLGLYINADDIAKFLRGYSPNTPQSALEQLAWYAADALRSGCVKEKVSFSFETVMSHSSKIEFLREAKSLSYFTTMYFIGTEDAALNVERVKQRVATGGHHVDADKIVARWTRTMELLRPAILACDVIHLFDNSMSKLGIRHICVIRNGGSHSRQIEMSDPTGKTPNWVTRFALQ